MHASTFLVIALIAISFPAMALLLALGLCKAAKTADMQERHASDALMRMQMGG